MTRPIDWDAVRAHRATYQPPTAVCRCGITDADTPDGRQRHRVITGHSITAERPPEIEPLGISPHCRAGAHTMCGGGYLRMSGPAECGCGCGHVDGVPRAFAAATCDNDRAELKTALTSSVVEHLSQGLTPTKEGLVPNTTREPASRPSPGER